MSSAAVVRKLSELRTQGNTKYDEKDYSTASKFFKDAIGVFLDNRIADPDCIEEFVKVAGNLCMCYYTQGDLDNCLTTARELISVYPIVPKAYGAIGMCIVDRLKEQNERLAHTLSGEELRGDPSRYVVKVGGVQCSADEAHMHLTRAVLLSNDSLKVTLGPYIDSAVRFISEQLLSGSAPLERGAKGRVLEEYCPAEATLPDRPNALGTTEVVMKPRIRLMDAMTNQPADLQDKQPTQEEMEAVLVAGGQKELPAPSPSSVQPLDFMLSQAAVPVRVCHSERGGLPRGLTLRRVEVAFGLSNILRPKAPPTSTVVAGPDPSEGEVLHSHIDPSTGLEVGMVMMPDQNPNVPSGSPVGLTCVGCGKESVGGYSTHFTPCGECDSAAFCSTNCQEKYHERHSVYECPLLANLRRALEQIRTEKRAARQQRAGSGRVEVIEEGEDEQEAPARTEEGVQTDSEVLPGSGWGNWDLQRRVLPLAFAVYSGIMTKAPGWETVVEVLERGVHHLVRCWLPEETQRVIELVADSSLPHFEQYPVKNSKDAQEALLTLLLVTRLYATHSEDSESSSFFVERTFFRHSCEPNCCWSGALRSWVTTRYVYKGEEMTQAIDPSFPQHWPLQIRRKWLARYHGFQCGCERCTREESRLNHSRGDLSNDLTEQLLTADTLRREGKAARHPTHYFHSALHKVIPVAVVEGPKAEKARQELADIAREMPKYLISSHYLFEDLRDAQLKIALVLENSDVAIREGRDSLLFLESMWPGAIPAKMLRMQDTPMVFDTRRRRLQNRSTRHRQELASGAAETSGSPTKGEEGTSTKVKRSSRTRPQIERDYKEGTVVDQHIGSYHAWYCM